MPSAHPDHSRARPTAPRVRLKSTTPIARARAIGVVALAALAPLAAAAAPASAQAPGGPLALVEAQLEQEDLRLNLRIVTAGDWNSADIVARKDRTLCVTFVHGRPAVPRGRACVTRRARRTAMSYATLKPDGTQIRRVRLAAKVRRPKPGVVTANFLPAAAGLFVGPYGWFASSAWGDDGACARTCRDRLPPGGGVVPARLGLLAVPPCFGAAARDPKDSCENLDLRRTITPSPRSAGSLQESYCDKRERRGLAATCAFGAQPDDARRSFALVGDSHAAGLKSALQVVTLAKHWRGVSILRPGCPLTKGRPLLPTAKRSRDCRRWNRDVIAFLERRREIRTVFLATHAGARVAGRGGRRGSYGATRDAYRSAIRELLRMRRQVVVVRDFPTAMRNHLRCVTSATKAGRDAGRACARPRRVAVKADPLASAARSLRSSRVRLIDLTPHICDARRCYAVVGGVLVHRDQTHLTSTFATTLGPYLLRGLG